MDAGLVRSLSIRVGGAALFLLSALMLYFFTQYPASGIHNAVQLSSNPVTTSWPIAYPERNLYFEVNAGQVDERVSFLARGEGYTLFLTSTGAYFRLANGNDLHESVLKVTLPGANAEAQASGEQLLPGSSHYYKGALPQYWSTDVPLYGAVRYQQVYPGVDLVYYGSDGQLEYDFIIAPGSDPSQIQLEFADVDSMHISDDGELIVTVSGEQIIQRPPFAYQQEKNGVRKRVASRYYLSGQNQVAFQVAAYDKSRPLIIDPVLVYSSFHGGSGDDRAHSMVMDSNGDLYVAGETNSVNFPESSGSSSLAGDKDIFVSKFSQDGTLLYSVYLGGSRNDIARDIAVDGSGNAYITGETLSADFPTTTGADDTTCPVLFSGTANNLQGIVWDGAQFVVVGGNGAILTSPDRITWTVQASGAVSNLQGIVWDGAQFVAVGGNGAILTSSDGITWTAQTSGTVSNLQGIVWDGAQFVAVSDNGAILTSPDGITWTAQASGTVNNLQGIVWGGAQFVAVGGNGAILTSPDRITWTGQISGTANNLQGIVWDGTQFVAVGGNGAILTSPDGATWIAVTNYNNIFYCADAKEAFVVKLNAAGILDSLTGAYATYLGGTLDDVGYAVAVDAGGNAFVVGSTQSVDFPTTGGVLQPALSGVNSNDGFVVKLNAAGSALTYATYLGGSLDDVPYDVDVDAGGNVYIAGFTLSADFPVVGAFDTSCGQDAQCGQTVANNRLVALGAGGAIITSPDGVAWTARVSGETITLQDIVWNGTQFVTVGDNGTILTSPDGVAWMPRTFPTAHNVNNLQGIVWNNSQFVSVGSAGTILSSPDGANWTTRVSASTANLQSIAWNGSLFVAVGSGGTILTSPNGITWADASSDVTDNQGMSITIAEDLQDILWSEAQFLVVGNGGTILTSVDGMKWFAQSSGSSVALQGTARQGTQYAAVGDAGTVLTSTNAVTWTAQSSGSASNLAAVAWSDAAFRSDAFVSKLNATGTALSYSTFLGGEGYDFANGIRIDAAGNAYITGSTRSAGLATGGVYQTTLAGSDDAFLARLNAAGDGLDFFTYLGGKSRDIGQALDLDGAGNVYVTGSTYSTDFPTANGLNGRSARCSEKNSVTTYACEADVFVSKLDTAGVSLGYSLYLGGNKSDHSSAIVVDSSGLNNVVYISGYSDSALFPVTGTAVQPVHGDVNADNVVDQSDVWLARTDDRNGDLAVTVSDAVDPVTVGDNISYSMVVTNNTVLDVFGIEAQLQLGAGLAFVSAAAGCSEDAGLVTCRQGQLAASASTTFSVIAMPRQEGDYASSVSVSAYLNDSDSSNNTGNVATTVILAGSSTTTGTGAYGLMMLLLGLLGLVFNFRRQILI